MGMRSDIEAMERHKANGTLREWFEGTAPVLDIDGRELKRVYDTKGKPVGWGNYYVGEVHASKKEAAIS